MGANVWLWEIQYQTSTHHSNPPSTFRKNNYRKQVRDCHFHLRNAQSAAKEQAGKEHYANSHIFQYQTSDTEIINDGARYLYQADVDTFILDFDKICDVMFPNIHPSARQIAGSSSLLMILS